MTTAFEVATKITMVNGITGVLAVISDDVLKLNISIKALQESFNTLGATAKAALGGLAIEGGMRGINFIGEMADHARDLNHELTQLMKLNMSQSDYDMAKKRAFSIASRVPGTTSAEGLKIFSETYSMFGPENAAKIMDPLAKFAQVAGNMSGDYKGAYDNIYSFVRSGELMGKFLDEKTHLVDTEKLMKFLDLGSRVMQATRGKVDAATWLGLAQQGGPSLSLMDPQGLYTMAIVSQAMGGQRAGTALMSAFQQMAGGNMTQYAAQILSEKYHLLGGYSVGKGGHLVWDPGALNTEFGHALGHDPLVAMEMLMKVMGENGLTDMEKIIPELFQMLGRTTTQRLFHDMLRNLPQMKQERARIMAGLGASQAFDVQNSQDYNQIEHNYDAAKQEMLAKAGLAMQEASIPVMKELTKIFLDIANWAKDHGQAIEIIGAGFSLVFVAAVAAGTGMIISAMLTLGGPTGLLAGVAGAITAYALVKWDKIKEWLGKFNDGLASFANTVKDWGESFGKWLDGFLNQLKDWLSKAWAKLTDWVKGLFGLASYADGGGGGGLLHNASFGGGGSSGGGGASGSFGGQTDFSGPHDPKTHLSVGLQNAVQRFMRDHPGVHINSGYRSFAEQAALLAKYGRGRAAAPGHSHHETGDAVDLGGMSDAAARDLSKYGLYRPYSWERWHVELMKGAHNPVSRAATPLPKSSPAIEVSTTLSVDGQTVATGKSTHHSKAYNRAYQKALKDHDAFVKQRNDRLGESARDLKDNQWQKNWEDTDHDQIVNKTYKPPNIPDFDPDGTINPRNWESWREMSSDGPITTEI